MLHVFRQLFRAPGFALTVTLFLGVPVAALVCAAFMPLRWALRIASIEALREECACLPHRHRWGCM